MHISTFLIFCRFILKDKGMTKLMIGEMLPYFQCSYELYSAICYTGIRPGWRWRHMSPSCCTGMQKMFDPTECHNWSRHVYNYCQHQKWGNQKQWLYSLFNGGGFPTENHLIGWNLRQDTNVKTIKYPSSGQYILSKYVLLKFNINLCYQLDYRFVFHILRF